MEAPRIARFLPEVYRAAIQPSSVLAALLAAMETLQAPDEEILAGVDRFIDPVRTRDDFAPLLASWLGLAPYLDWSGGRAGAGAPLFAPGLDRLRLLATKAADLNARRGSRAALEEFLGAATGAAGFAVEENPPDAAGRPRPFHIRVCAPAEARRYADLVARIVEGERPAYATYEISYAPAAPPPGAKAEGK
jgi:hypothetical protein